jgi:hypothetical protein
MALSVILRSTSLRKAIELLVEDAPTRVKVECWFLNDQRRFRSALDLALAWRAGREDPDSAENYVYAPLGEFERVFQIIPARNDEREEGSTKTLQFDQTTVQSKSTLVTAKPLAVVELLTSPKDVSATELPGSRHPPLQERVRGSKRKAEFFERPSKACRTVQQSRNFTERLEALLGGDTVNMLLGTGSGNLTSVRSALSGAKPFKK